MNGIGKVACWVKWPELVDTPFYSIRALRNAIAARMKSRIQDYIKGTNMCNEIHLAKIKKGVKAWNQWRRDHPELRPNLRGCRWRIRSFSPHNNDLDSLALDRSVPYPARP